MQGGASERSLERLRSSEALPSFFYVCRWLEFLRTRQKESFKSIIFSYLAAGAHLRGCSLHGWSFEEGLRRVKEGGTAETGSRGKKICEETKRRRLVATKRSKSAGVDAFSSTSLQTLIGRSRKNKAHSLNLFALFSFFFYLRGLDHAL